MYLYFLKYYRLKGVNNGKILVVIVVMLIWGVNFCILWIFYLILLIYFWFSCIIIVNLNKKMYKWNMLMKKVLFIFDILLYWLIEN